VPDPAQGVFIGKPQNDEKYDKNAQYSSENDWQTRYTPFEKTGMHEVVPGAAHDYL
jgi:hypothetical protein